jgi:signal transduction histidine kinase
VTGQGGKLPIRSLPCRQLADLLSGRPQRGNDVLIQDLALAGDDGEERIYQARIAVVRSEDGDYRGRITLLHDVTRERELDRMKSDFVSTAAHELRTPLSTILGYTELMLIQSDQSREHFSEYLQLIQDKAENLAQIVGDLLDISRIEAGEGLQLSFERCDLEKICRHVVEEFSIDLRGHRFFTDFPKEPILIEADRYALIQVLENIIGNAIKYSPGGGEIRLAGEVEGGVCRLSISDTGLGVQPGHLDRVFEKFYRVDATNTAISGTGLGLTIVKYLVEAHRGTVRLESQPAKGTTVRLELPLVQ